MLSSVILALLTHPFAVPLHTFARVQSFQWGQNKVHASGFVRNLRDTAPARLENDCVELRISRTSQQKIKYVRGLGVNT